MTDIESNGGQKDAESGMESGDAIVNAEVVNAEVLRWGSKSKAIRGLASEGVVVAEIARRCGLRYQHVRNVLSQPLKREIKAARDAAKLLNQQGEGK